MSNQTEVATSEIVNWFAGQTVNSEGRYVADILCYTEVQLETDHRYIQWLLPTRTTSKYNPYAPILTEDDVKAINGDARMRQTFAMGLNKMLTFWGIMTWDTRRQVYWLGMPGSPVKLDHNMLRVTRMLECVQLFGLKQVCDSIWKELNRPEIKDRVPPNTWKHWTKAIHTTW